MNVFTKLYEKLFVPADVRKLLAAFRDGRLVVVGSYYCKVDKYDCGLAGSAHAEFAKPGVEGVGNSLKIYYDGDCLIRKDGIEGSIARPKGYVYLVKAAYRKHLASKKAARLIEKEQILSAFNADMDEIFGDIKNLNT